MTLLKLRPGLLAGSIVIGLLLVFSASGVAERAARLQLSSALHYE